MLEVIEKLSNSSRASKFYDTSDIRLQGAVGLASLWTAFTGCWPFD